MVSRYYITRNLKSLNQMYSRSKTQAEPLYFSKLAIIELCGWIEVSIDKIFETCSPKLVRASCHQKNITDRINRTYGFSQKKHLQPLINTLIGYNGLEKLETSCDLRLLEALNRNLNELSNMRNMLAHTYIKGFTITVESPQLKLRRLDHVANGLDHLEEKIGELSDKLSKIS